HRYSDFKLTPHERAHILPKTTLDDLQDPSYEPLPFYWLPKEDMEERFEEKEWPYKWVLGFRDVTDSRASPRSFVGSVIPRVAVEYKFQPMLTYRSSKLVALVQAIVSSICLDYFAMKKIGGLPMNFFIVKQLPVLSPDLNSELLITVVT